MNTHTPSNLDLTQPPHGTPTIDELAAHCFGCGHANPQGLHLHFHLDTSDPEHPIAQAIVNLTELHQGPPGHIHGGIVATLFDEAMSKLNRPLKVLAMTRHLEVDYLRPAPLHTPLTLTARHLRREGSAGRKLFHTSISSSQPAISSPAAKASSSSSTPSTSRRPAHLSLVLDLASSTSADLRSIIDTLGRYRNTHQKFRLDLATPSHSVPCSASSLDSSNC